MKKLLLAVLLLTACKKETIKPSGKGTMPVVNDFIYRVVKCDTAKVYLNGKSIEALNVMRTQSTIIPGDTLKFYFSSVVDSAGGFNFAIWNSGNFLTSETIKYYYPKRDNINGRYFIEGTFVR